MNKLQRRRFLNSQAVAGSIKNLDPSRSAVSRHQRATALSFAAQLLPRPASRKGLGANLVIPAKAGIQAGPSLDSGFRRKDEGWNGKPVALL